MPKKSCIIEFSKLQKGDIVTFAYESWTRKTLPTNPKIFRIRKDVLWDHILNQFEKKSEKEQFLNCMYTIYLIIY